MDRVTSALIIFIVVVSVLLYGSVFVTALEWNSNDLESGTFAVPASPSGEQEYSYTNDIPGGSTITDIEISVYFSFANNQGGAESFTYWARTTSASDCAQVGGNVAPGDAEGEYNQTQATSCATAGGTSYIAIKYPVESHGADDYQWDQVYVKITYTGAAAAPFFTNMSINNTKLNWTETIKLNASVGESPTEVNFTIRYPPSPFGNFSEFNWSASSTGVGNEWANDTLPNNIRGVWNLTKIWARNAGGIDWAYANDTNGQDLNWSVYDTPTIQVTLSPANVTRDGNITITAYLENSTSDGVPDQNISFKNDTTLLGYNLTDSTGYAYFTWNTTLGQDIGSITINASYLQNDTFYYRGYENATETTYVYANTTVNMSVSNSTSVNAGDNVLLTAQLRYDNGTSIIGDNITWYRNDTGGEVFIGSSFTNTTGDAIIVWDTTSLSSADYKINATHPENTSSFTNSSFNDTLIITVAAAPDTDPPTWSGDNTNNPASYTGTTQTILGIVWSDATLPLDTVIFETNISGQLENFTNSSNTCKDTGICNYTLGVLKVSTFNWTAYANDTVPGNGWSKSDTWIWTTAKGDPAGGMTLTSLPSWNELDGIGTTVEGSEDNNGDVGFNYELWREIGGTYTSIGQGSPVSDVSTLAIGIYTYRYNITLASGNENYTYGFKTDVLTISADIPPITYTYVPGFDLGGVIYLFTMFFSLIYLLYHLSQKGGRLTGPKEFI